jgi:hypothetical protein
VLHDSFKVWPFLCNLLNAHPRHALNPQGKLGGAPAFNACDPGSDAIVIEVILCGAPRVDRLDLALVYLRTIVDKKLAVGPDKRRGDGDAGDGDGVDPLVGADGSGGCSRVDVGEEGWDVGTGGGDGDALGDSWEQDGAPGEGYDGEGWVRLGARHGRRCGVWDAMSGVESMGVADG